MTLVEKKLWQDCLRNFPHRVLRQRPIDNFIVDFYCAALKLVIEIDGESHFTEQGRLYDQERSQILESYGLRIVRFTNREVLEDFEGVCEKLRELIPPNPLKKGGFEEGRLRKAIALWGHPKEKRSHLGKA
ncbi:MAG: endonuclease domain-containing protein [Desertifilum sp.]|nr:endonuclease domain-containing protein [Desertifilum sp.]